MFQLDQNTRYSDIWSNVILGVSVRVLSVLARLIHEIGTLSKGDCLPLLQVGPIQSIEGLDRTKKSEKEGTLPARVPQS